MSKRKSLPADRVSTNVKLYLQEHSDGPSSEYWYDITLGYYPDGRLGEVFIRDSNDPALVVYDALAMAISVGLQHGAPFDSYRKHLEFQGGAGPAGLAADSKAWRSKVSSPLDMIAKWVGEHQQLENVK